MAADPKRAGVEVGWLTRSAADLPATLDWLHPRERAWLDGLRFPKRRRDWLLGRWTAKAALRSKLLPDLPPRDIALLPAEDGAPEIFLPGGGTPPRLSLSHSHGRSLCVVSPAPVAPLGLGCDLEKVAIRSEALVRDHFTVSEQARSRNPSGTVDALWSTLIWSAKESMLKALRTGLRIDTRRVEVRFGSDRSPGVWHPWSGAYADKPIAFVGYWRYAEGFILTLGCDRGPVSLREL